VTYHCPNCSQPVLGSDTICWHCGWQLPERKTKKPEPETIRKAEEQRPFPLSAVIIYTALTIAVIMATLLVMRSLGQKPLDAGGAEAQPGRGWVSATNQNQTFAKPGSLLVARSQDLSQAPSEQTISRHRLVTQARMPTLRVGHQHLYALRACIYLSKSSP
jgi:hypothetical protein